MTQDAFGEIALQLGWTRHHYGDGTFTFDLGDRLAAVTPFARRMRDGAMIDLGEFCYSKELVEAVEHVFGAPSDWGILAKRRPTTRATLLSVDTASAGALLQGAIDWAGSVDRQTELEYLAGLHGEVDPGAAMQHLAALALLGRTAQLRDYQERVGRGDHTGLSLAITDYSLERALDLTMGRQYAGA